MLDKPSPYAAFWPSLNRARWALSSARRAHRQDTMEGRFVVAFVALSILAELKHQLSKRRTFEDKRKKDIPEKAYSVSDVLDITAGTTINYGVRTKQHWTGGTAILFACYIFHISRINAYLQFTPTISI